MNNGTIFALFVWLISHQPAVLFSQNKPATNNQPAVLFSQNEPAPTTSHQPNEQAAYRSEEAPLEVEVLGWGCRSSISAAEVATGVEGSKTEADPWVTMALFGS
jgi:hypothetical protein